MNTETKKQVSRKKFKCLYCRRKFTTKQQRRMHGFKAEKYGCDGAEARFQKRFA